VVDRQPILEHFGCHRVDAVQSWPNFNQGARRLWIREAIEAARRYTGFVNKCGVLEPQTVRRSIGR